MTGLNRRPPVCKTDALPAELNPHMEQVMGIEPTPTAWQAVVLAIILHLHLVDI